MADILKKYPTPNNRIMKLEIDIIEPKYDSEGEPIIADLGDESTPAHMK
jgi:hypothetical protein